MLCCGIQDHIALLYCTATALHCTILMKIWVCLIAKHMDWGDSNGIRIGTEAWSTWDMHGAPETCMEHLQCMHVSPCLPAWLWCMGLMAMLVLVHQLCISKCRIALHSPEAEGVRALFAVSTSSSALMAGPVHAKLKNKSVHIAERAMNGFFMFCRFLLGLCRASW